MKIAKKIAWGLLVVFIGMQFYRPKKNLTETEHANEFIIETNPPKEVRAILETACYDCHSNNTTYPWYNNIAPVSFWIANHIWHGKGHLNVSEWNSYGPEKKDHKFEEIIEVMEENSMPLKEYTWTHQNARLSEEQKEAISEWAKRTRALYQLGPRPE